MTVETHDRIEPLSAEWDELATRTGAPPWLRPGWIGAWWDAFGAGSLRILAVRDGDELAAVLPMALRHGALVSPTNWHTPEFGLLAATAEARGELARAVFGQRRRHVAISFVPRPDLERVETEARTAGYRVLARVRERSPYVAVGGAHEDYLSTLDRKHVKEVRRLRRRLEEQGEVRFELVADDPAALDECLEIERSGWKGERGTAIASQAETLAFYRAVAAWAAGRGTFRIAFLRVEGRAVAFEYLLEDGGVLYDVKGAYDEEFRRFAPGHLVASELIAYAFANDLSSFEFLGADEPFKLAWTNTVRERMHLDAFAPGPVGAVGLAAHAYGRPLARRALELLRG